MSELINNRQMKQEKLKEIILKLHNGASVEDVKAEFDSLTVGVSPSEITQMEQALVDGGLPVQDIQRLCDVHASVFKGSIEDIHKEESEDLDEWHPASVLKEENRALEEIVESVIKRLERKNKQGLLDELRELAKIDIHYRRKENVIFPYMEKYNITAPPQVMWGVDDEIRTKIHDITNWVEAAEDISSLEKEIYDMTAQISEMIFKEEEIMLPMVMDVFTQDEWLKIDKAGDEIGYIFIDEKVPWIPSNQSGAPLSSFKSEGVFKKYVTAGSDSKVSFDAGSLTAQELNAILNTVPFDMTFVGEDNRVKYFTQGKERIFERPITIIGREVKNCHPPKSVHIVESIVEDLRSGRKDHEDFWLNIGERFVHIRYFAVRSKEGQYLGTLEVSQDIKPITELEGEKRLVDD